MDAVEARDCGLFLDLAAARAAEFSIFEYEKMSNCRHMKSVLHSREGGGLLTLVHVESCGAVLIENQASVRQ